jgi:DNA-directed RNA polymerase subunit M/transcription elongation factor TFIIS
MTDSNKCPQCGAVMEAKTIGLMHDKVMACSYCGYLVDVPDEYEDARAYDEITPDGARRKVTVARKRSDLRPDSQASQLTNPTYEETKETITDRPGRNIHTKTVVTTSVRNFNSNSSKFDESIRQVIESGAPINFNSQEDLDVFKNMLPPDLQAKFRGEVGGPGNIKTTTFKKSFTISDPATAAKILDQMSDLGDVKADAKLLKEIMDNETGNKTVKQFKGNANLSGQSTGATI